MFPIQGNHDTWPVNVEDFGKEGVNGPINSYKLYWKEWLDEETVELYEKFGYYS